MPTALDDTWPLIQAELRGAVPESTYRIWLAGLQPRALDARGLVLETPDSTYRWVVDRFTRVIQTCAAAVIGPEVPIDVVRASEPDGSGPAGTRRPTDARGTRAREDAASLHPSYRFDQFVIGAGNRFAHAAALAVAELPGQAYNPLFLYGPPGTGKTHLLHSIAHYIAAHGAGLTVRYVTVESFTNAFLDALQTGGMDKFKRTHRRADVLLVDDVQFLESKAKTEEEFFHTFNALYESGSQLVLTSDRMPRDLAAVEDRLRERFESGLVADLARPDFDTRLTYLHKLAGADRLDLADERPLELLAERVTDSMRALEGAMIRVVAYHSLTGRAVDADLVTEVLDRTGGAAAPSRRSVRDIQLATCEAFDISIDDLVSPSRAARVTWPRQVAMYLSRELTHSTLPTIGRQFGGRNHTTVLHACRRASERLAHDPEAATLVESMTSRLQARGDRSD